MSENLLKQIRNGPHPLGLHVASTTNMWTGATAAFPLFQLGGLQIHPDLQNKAEDLRKDISNHNAEDLLPFVMKQAQSRLAETLAGIRLYQYHPYQRKVKPAPLFHKIGSTEILDYGDGHQSDVADDSPIVIAVPSLVNPAYILDLKEDHSFMHTLAEMGIHPYLLDWCAPEDEELGFNLEDYILKRLIPMIYEVHRHHNKKIHLMGYCMGGNLSLAAAQILEDDNIIESLTLIATPWDFHAQQPTHLSALTDYFLKMDQNDQKTASSISDMMELNIMQLFFFSLDPTLSDRKFRKFSHFDPASDKAENFVAIEDWAGDGCPLSPEVSKDCLINWYQKNQPHKKCWRVAGHVISPRSLNIPGHIITPTADRIVPAASAKALRDLLPNFAHTTANGGHVSMIAGKDAKTILWPIIASFLK